MYRRTCGRFRRDTDNSGRRTEGVECDTVADSPVVYIASDLDDGALAVVSHHDRKRRSLGPGLGVSCCDAAEVEVGRVMLQRGDRLVQAADHSTWGGHSFKTCSPSAGSTWFPHGGRCEQCSREWESSRRSNDRHRRKVDEGGHTQQREKHHGRVEVNARKDRNIHRDVQAAVRVAPSFQTPL